MPQTAPIGHSAPVGAETSATLRPQGDIFPVGISTFPSKNPVPEESKRVASMSSSGLSLSGTIQKAQKSWEASRASAGRPITATATTSNNNNRNDNGTADYYGQAHTGMERVNNVKHGHAPPPKVSSGNLGKRSSLPGGDDAQHAHKRRAIESPLAANTAAIAGGASTPTPKTAEGTPVLRAVRSAPNKSLMHTLRGTPESKEARQKLLEKTPSGRCYRVFTTKEGISVPTLGVPIPDGYEQYDDEACPWICPVRSCRNLLRNTHALSGHFGQAHRFCNLNDNGDGTLSIVGKFKAPPGHTAARVISRKPLDPKEPPMATPRRPLQSRPLAGERRESGSAAAETAGTAGPSPGVMTPPVNPAPKQSPAPVHAALKKSPAPVNSASKQPPASVNPPQVKSPDLTNPAPKKSTAPVNPTRRESAAAPSTPTPSSSSSGGDPGTKMMQYLRNVLPEGFDFGLFTTSREGPFLLQLAVRRDITPAWIKRATGIKPHLPRALLALLLYLSGTPADDPCPSCVTADSREQCIVPSSFFPVYLIEKFGGSCAACFYRCTRWHHKTHCLLATKGANKSEAASQVSESPLAGDDSMVLDAAGAVSDKGEVVSPVEEEPGSAGGDVDAPGAQQDQPQPAVSPPTKSPADSLIQGSLISADVLDMEDWEIAPGTVRTTSDDQVNNVAYSNAYLFSNIAVAVEPGVGFNLITLKPGGFHKFKPEDSLRLCSLSTGKLSVKIEAPGGSEDKGEAAAGGELSFRIGPNGMFKVRPGATCSVQNRVYVDAVLHVTSIEV
ncbi:uncharacterized protein DNG_01994 [Cephalotrichum gorgonifer]|uniref:Uncharacterized protein n=1 Tax=Cephalotrichum gorgonifer TaxID=2041049 RepID=A0AAE8MSK4_9PEZI|nr:uncharacterized protein DNG_01994 [Cephalotrichum gorgonifer]